MKEFGRGYTGHMLEHENLGEMSKEGKEKYKNYLPLLDQKVSIMEVVRVVEACQREECIKPGRYFSRRLRREVATLLGLDLEENPYNVEFYTSVDTILDSNFGTDAFLRIKEPGTNFNAMVTLDITENTSKDKHKADIIVLFPEGSLDETNKEEKEKLDAIVTDTAKKIQERVEILKNKFFKKTA